MSGAKWCDFGNHAFSANAENAQSLSITRNVRNEWGGQQPHTVLQDICPECAATMGLLDPEAELQAVKTRNDNRKALKATAQT
jgi:hypothetical protein